MSALYCKIKDDLLSKILDGTYKEGDIIPSEIELAAHYGVSRPTIRQAVQILSNEGYLEKRRRRGTMVCRPKVEQLFTAGLRSFADDMAAVGRKTRTNVTLCRVESPSSIVANALGLRSSHEHVLKLIRLRYVDLEPNVLVETYVPVALYPGIEDWDFEKRSLYEAMEQLGSPVETAHRRLEITKASPSAAALLDVPLNDPIYVFYTNTINQNGLPCEYSISLYRGENNVFQFDVDGYSNE